MNLRTLALLVFTICFAQNAIAGDVSNVSAKYLGDEVKICYDLDSPYPLPVQVAGSSDGGENYDLSMQTLKGEIGPKTEPGEGRCFSWLLYIDYPRGLRADKVVFKVSTVQRDLRLEKEIEDKKMSERNIPIPTF